MAKFLSQDWLDQARQLAEDQPAFDGATAKVQFVVSRGREGDIKFHELLENGKLLDARLGELPDADLTLTLPYADAAAVQRGELDPSVAFMQGRLKVAGDTGKLIDLLPLTRSPEYARLQDRVREITEFE
ncbi:MAG: SCP2 sterol-binding domain-containing protein [Actinobacteria bacterium]|nr:SCP2 sterol-binding domain-containing protein [Actinomycetota bacterium]